jgi:hypothetical protein
MTLYLTTAVLTLASIVTAILAFGVREPARGIAVMLFIMFISLDALSAVFEFRDYRTRHPRHRV